MKEIEVIDKKIKNLEIEIQRAKTGELNAKSIEFINKVLDREMVRLLKQRSCLLLEQKKAEIKNKIISLFNEYNEITGCDNSTIEASTIQDVDKERHTIIDIDIF